MMYCASNCARRDGGYVYNRSLCEFVPTGENGELEREWLHGFHPLCVVVSTGDLSVKFLKGLHSQTGMPEFAVLCVENLKVILLINRRLMVFVLICLGPQIILDDHGTLVAFGVIGDGRSGEENRATPSVAIPR
jgi:hypothetical protein